MQMLLPLVGAMMTSPSSDSLTAFSTLLPLVGAMMTGRTAAGGTTLWTVLLPLVGAMMTAGSGPVSAR